MKPTLFAALLAIGTWQASFAQNNIGIGTNTPQASALLDVSSTTKGFLPPRMSSAQRNAIVAPATGLMVYDSDLKDLYSYNGTQWKRLSGGVGGGLTLPYDTTVDLNTYVIKVANTSTSSEYPTLRITSASTSAIEGFSTAGSGVVGSTSFASGYGVQGRNLSNGVNGAGVYGQAGNSFGVLGESTGNAGVRGISTYSNGVWGSNAGSSSGVYGNNSATGTGVYARGFNGTGLVADLQAGGTGTAARILNPSGSGYALEIEGKLKISAGNTNPGAGKLLTSDASGNATWQKPLASRVGFSASGQATGGLQIIYGNQWGKLSFLNEHYDPGNDFYTYAQSPASVFVVPVSGLYQLNASGGFAWYTEYTYYGGGIRFVLQRNGSTTPFAEKVLKADEILYTEFQESISGSFRLLAGDKIWVEAIGYTNGNYAGLLTNSNQVFFNGFLVHEE